MVQLFALFSLFVLYAQVDKVNYINTLLPFVVLAYTVEYPW